MAASNTTPCSTAACSTCCDNTGGTSARTATAYSPARSRALNKPAPEDPLWSVLENDWDFDFKRKYWSIGLEYSSIVRRGDYRGLKFECNASPGHPLCVACREPLAVSVEGMVLRTTCPGCGANATYAIPEEKKKYPALVGVISDENRSDAPDVRTEAAQGNAALAVRCPNCNGALESPQAGQICTCPFCQTPSHIPARIFQLATGQAMPSEPWWLLFKGSSPLRDQVNLQIQRKLERQSRRERKRQQDLEFEAELRANKLKRLKKILMVVSGVVIVVALIVFLIA